MDKTITLGFGKDKTSIIKGIAIIFMIIHHCGSGNVFATFKLCVGIFTFMVGYGYAFAKVKDWRYSLQHIKKLLIPFWTILFVFTFPVMYAQGNLGDAKMILLNMFGINSVYNYFSWFVAFFIYAMIVMPLIFRFIDRRPIVWTFVFIIFAYLGEVAVHSIPWWSDNDWTQRLFDCLLCTPGMLLGYLFAREGWYTKVKVPAHWYVTIAAVLLAVVVLVLRHYVGSIAGFNLDFFYAPMFILPVLIIFNQYKLSLLTKILMALGNVSVYMWFFHALFFTKSVSDIYQPLVMVSDSLWIVIPWTIIITYICSWIIQYIVINLNKMINKFCNV